SDHWRAWVKRNRVTVHGDFHLCQEVFALLTVQLAVTQVNEYQVNIGATGQHADTLGNNVFLGQTFSQDACTSQGALLALLELWRPSNLEGYRLTRNRMLQRTTLLTREHRRIQLLRNIRIIRQ